MSAEYKPYNVSSAIEDKLRNNCKVTGEELELYHDYVKKNLTLFFKYMKEFNGYYSDKEYYRLTNTTGFQTFTRDTHEHAINYAKNILLTVGQDMNNVWLAVSNQNRD